MSKSVKWESSGLGFMDLCIPRAGPDGPLLACQDFMVLALPLSIFLENTTNRPIFYMTPRKSHHVRKARINWEQKRASPAAEDPKITKKTARTEEKTVLKPVITDPLSKTVEFDADHLSELPIYKSSLELEFEASESLVTNLTKSQTF